MNSPLRSVVCLSALSLASVSLFGAEQVSAPVSLDKLLSAEEFRRSGLYKLSEDELSELAAALARHALPPGETSPTLAAVPATNQTPSSETLARPATHGSGGTKMTNKAESEAFGAEQVEQIRPVVTEKELHSKIEGPLEAVTGRSVFLLENGQVWQQRIPETIYFSPRLQNPTVIISRGLIGYKMLIVEADRFIYVKRIK